MSVSAAGGFDCRNGATFISLVGCGLPAGGEERYFKTGEGTLSIGGSNGFGGSQNTVFQEPAAELSHYPSGA